MVSRADKKKILGLLKSPDLRPAIEELSRVPARKAVNSLFTFLYHENPLIKWNAVTAMGLVVSRLADEDMEGAREVVRRLMWNLNDESGGIGWGSAEAMGEILASNTFLASEYSSILLSYAREDGNFQEHELMQRGVLWAIGRLAQVNPEKLQDATPHIIPFLISRDSTVRGLAAWVLSHLPDESARPELERLMYDTSPVQIYLNRDLVDLSVDELAAEALKRLPVRQI